jgi:lysine 2,3-aminomutase
MNENEEIPKPPGGEEDWRWQLKNRIKDVKGLEKYIKVSEKEKEDLSKCLKNFRMAITPYYASLMDADDPNCPIRLQAIPTYNELNTSADEKDDPLGEDRQSPVKGLVHRYPNRVLLLTTYRCAMYCRHCTRRRIVGSEDIELNYEELNKCIEYIKSDPQITDVLVSGGDPLTLSDLKLEYILRSIRDIKHVEIIRIGTRVPVVLPMRINEDLVNMLRRYHPLYVNTHFNHPKELTEASCRALHMLADAGIPLGNQTVLLRGINNDTEILKELFNKLIKNRVKPYYLYQCDLARGISHFRTTVDEGLEIMRELQGNISGMAIPKYVIDAPGGGGKIPILPDFYKFEEDMVILENYRHEEYTYPNRISV